MNIAGILDSRGNVMNVLKVLCAGVIATLLLAGCGGGGGSSSNGNTGQGNNATANTAPVANAGTATDATIGTAVTLDGSLSSDADGDTLGYSWTITSKPNGSSATLVSSTSVKPSFTPDIAGTYSISLVVSDGEVDSTSSIVTINAKQPTEVGGILTSDTTLTKVNSPYVINGNLQVPDGITLTIEPGVSISGNGMTIWGTLNAMGTANERIKFDNIYIEHGFNANDSRVNISFADIVINNKSSFSQNNATVSITDSVIRTTGNYIQIVNSKHTSNIERNTLIDTSITIGSGASPVNIINNNFIGLSQVFFWCSNSPVNVQYNSFLTGSTQVIRLPDYCAVSNMTVTSDYWGTTDTSKIESMIYDHRQYYGISTTIDYLPILNTADTNTPDPTPYLN